MPNSVLVTLISCIEITEVNSSYLGRLADFLADNLPLVVFIVLDGVKKRLALKIGISMLINVCARLRVRKR